MLTSVVQNMQTMSYYDRSSEWSPEPAQTYPVAQITFPVLDLHSTAVAEHESTLV